MSVTSDLHWSVFCIWWLFTGAQCMVSYCFMKKPGIEAPSPFLFFLLQSSALLYLTCHSFLITCLALTDLHDGASAAALHLCLLSGEQRGGDLFWRHLPSVFLQGNPSRWHPWTRKRSSDLSALQKPVSFCHSLWQRQSHPSVLSLHLQSRECKEAK